MAAINSDVDCRFERRKAVGRNVGMNRDRLCELFVVVSLIGGFALMIAECTIGENQRLSFKVPRGDAWS